MRTFVLVTACILIFATEPAIAQDCAAIQTACINQCFGASGQLSPSGIAGQALATNNVPGRVKACINRCRIAPCGQTPLTTQLCDATAQTICNNSFRACNVCVRPIDCDDCRWNPVSGFVWDLLLYPVSAVSQGAPLRPKHHRCH